MRRFFALGLVLLLGACGTDQPTAPPVSPDVVTLSPVDGATNVGVSDRITAQITLANARDTGCRMDITNTTVTLTAGGNPVMGSTVVFVDGLRADFTTSGMLDFDTPYSVTVQVTCAVSKTSSFTTGPQPAVQPNLQVGDAFEARDLTVSEPSVLASVLRDFLDDANIVFQVLDFDSTAGTFRALGGEGDPAWALAPVGLAVFLEDAFIFPMNGVYKAPFFQIEGTLTIPVNNSTTLRLDRFEISGRLLGDSPNVEITGGNIRASSPCDTVCLVDDMELQLICANRSDFCDGNGNLNLIGTFDGEPNDLDAWQTLTVTPADNAMGFPPTDPVVVRFNQEVQNPDGVIITIFDGAGDTVTDSKMCPTCFTLDMDRMGGSFQPAMALASNTTFSLLTIAHSAIETTFTTGN